MTRQSMRDQLARLFPSSATRSNKSEQQNHNLKNRHMRPSDALKRLYRYLQGERDDIDDVASLASIAGSNRQSIKPTTNAEKDQVRVWISEKWTPDFGQAVK